MQRKHNRSKFVSFEFQIEYILECGKMEVKEGFLTVTYNFFLHLVASILPYNQHEHFHIQQRGEFECDICKCAKFETVNEATYRYSHVHMRAILSQHA